jgi:predicted nucleic-acid-binding protein
MLGLEANVLVRFLVRDHEAQFERAADWSSGKSVTGKRC